MSDSGRNARTARIVITVPRASETPAMAFPTLGPLSVLLQANGRARPNPSV